MKTSLTLAFSLLQGARWGAGSTESGELNLSVSHLPEGLYFLKLQNSEGTATKRVVVKRL